MQLGGVEQFANDKHESPKSISPGKGTLIITQVAYVVA